MASVNLRHSARQRLARETSLVTPDAAAAVRVVLAYPNTYSIGMSNLGLHVIYRTLNARPGTSCERVFLPDPDELQEYDRSRTPLMSLESQRPVGDFDVIAFSSSFENDYPNVVRMLTLAGLAVRARDRRSGAPLVVMGGAAVSINPEPLADFIDVFCVGEGEALIEPLFETIERGGARDAMLAELASGAGFYVPSLYEPEYDETSGGVLRAQPPAPAQINKVRAPFDGSTSVARTTIRTPDTEFGDRVIAEVARGCTKGCRYCWVGYSILPFRVHTVADVLASLEEWRGHTDRVGLVATALLDHPDIEAIAVGLRERGFKVFSPSLIISTLREPLLRAVIESGQKTITIAPEAGSDRMRELIMKKITNAEILDKVRMIFRAGAVNLKNYIIIGLPGEEQEDLQAIVDLGQQMRDIMVQECRHRGQIGTVTLSINCLIPKPGTPFQWAEQLHPREYRRRMRWLRKAARAIPNLVIDAMPVRSAEIQAVLSRGDRRVGDLLIDWAASDDWKSSLRTFLEGSGRDLDWFLRERSPFDASPWDHLRVGAGPAALGNQWNKALDVVGATPLAATTVVVEPALR